MIEKIIYTLLIVASSISILFTIFYNIDGAVRSIPKLIKSYQASKNEVSVTREELKRSDLQKPKPIDLFLRFAFLDSKLKYLISLYLLSGSSVLLATEMNYQPKEKFILILLVFATLFMFIGICHFIHYSHRDKFINRGIYGMKLCIIIVYPLVAFNNFLSDINIVSLFLTILFSLIFTILFIKNIIDSFKPFLFQLINFLILIIAMNILYIGLSFGMFYLNNNSVFSYFSEENHSVIIDSSSWNNLYFIIYKGLDPFFGYPDNLKYEVQPIYYIPLVEHLIGYMFNLIIIGFFMTYSISIMLERRKTNAPVDTKGH